LLSFLFLLVTQDGGTENTCFPVKKVEKFFFIPKNKNKRQMNEFLLGCQALGGSINLKKHTYF
jgi:hypothetical protein